MIPSARWVVATGVSVLATAMAPAGSAKDEQAAPRRSEPAVRAASTISRLASVLGIGSRIAASRPALPSDAELALADEAGEPVVHISPRGTVEIHAVGTDLASVLQMLSVQSKRNIIASKGVSGTVTANLYDVTLEEALDAILAANDCGWRERGNFIYVYTNAELARLRAAEQPLSSRVFRLAYVTAADAATFVQPMLGPQGKLSVAPKAASGVSEGSTDSGGNTLASEDYLIVHDTPPRIEAIARLLSEIDVRPAQVLIEATILRAVLTEDNSLGIDFNIVGGVDFADLDSVSPGVQSLETGDVPQPELNNTNMTFRTDFNRAVPQGGFTFGIIKDSVAVFVRALEQVTDTMVLANPKVLALNKQRGEIIVGRKDGYLTTTVTETTATQTVEFLETGTQLIFRPFIGTDGYVRMEIHPKDSTGGLNASNLPFENTTEVTTNIMVRDGQTILIGGLFREFTQSLRGQVPYFGNLPIAGALFRTITDSTQREEVIILLTVRIVKDETKLVEESRRLWEDVERYRVGMRRGLQAFGRERLAQAHYRWALEHLAKGRVSKALWDAQIAGNLNPAFLAASDLTEKLRNERAWDDEGSAIRDFVALQIRREEGLMHAPHGRPAPPFVVPESLYGPSGFDVEDDAPAAPRDTASSEVPK